MKTILVAQHHGTFFTLNSLFENNIDDVVVIIPGSQVTKYNKMYSEHSTNKDYAAFKDYDKLVVEYIKANNRKYPVYVMDTFDVTNMLVSTLNSLEWLGIEEVVTCVLSGALVNKDYRPYAKDALQHKTFGMCYSRVYQTNSQLSMYHMIGLKAQDFSLDLNFYVVDTTKIEPHNLQMTDSQLLSDLTKKKQVTILGREFNGKDDVLIGSAISARQTIAHNLKIQSGFIINLWNKCIKPNDALKSEEVYGYPLNLYSKHSTRLDGFLPASTLKKIRENGDETEKLTSGLYGCLDIINL